MLDFELKLHCLSRKNRLSGLTLLLCQLNWGRMIVYSEQSLK